MTLWLILTIMIAAAAVLVSAPFIRRHERARLVSSADIAVYRDQLKEVESEAAQGVIDAAQAESASMEIKRRILAVDGSDDSDSAPISRDERRFALVAVTGIVVLGSVGLYAMTGSPELSGPASYATAEPAAVETPAKLSGLQAPVTRSTAAAAQNPAQAQSGLPPVDEMIQRLIARLQRNPQDPEGWRTLGWSYFSTERFADAAAAYGKAIALSPTVAEFRSARSEALIRAANGVVTPEARGALEDTLKLDPKDARARFFVGMAKEQAGDKAGALRDWNDVLADAGPDEPWLPDLKQRIADLGKDVGRGNASIRPAAPIVSDDGMLETLKRLEKSQAVGAIAKGPRPEDIRNAENMAPADRTVMIRGMVEGLASRLDQSPRDADGWIKLIRSRIVLGDTQMAKQSLERALAVFTDDATERGRIVAAAQQLGLTP